MTFPDGHRGKENSYAVTEIESSFLVRYLPTSIINGIRSGSLPYTDIEQGYFIRPLEGRIRREVTHDGRISFIQTHKRPLLQTEPPLGVSANIEYNRMLPEEEFIELWQKTETPRRSKRRYQIPGEDVHEGLFFELDVYRGGTVDGHMVVEVEFPTVVAATSFSPPDWFGINLIQEKQTTKIPSIDLVPLSAHIEL